MSSFSSISIRFSADLKDFSSQMSNAQRELNKIGKTMQKVGAGLTVGLTLPIVALGMKSVKAFDEQAKAIAQVEAGVKSTGKAAGYTTDQLLKMASDLQDKTLFGDESILKDATAQLLTFTNIAGDQFSRTQQAALDLATRLDGDLKSASIQLGKALNDPVANLSALSRSGIQFSKEQKEVINSLVSTNHLADAQNIILDELQKQYGGAAEAAAKAGLGPFQQLSNIVGDLTEDFGKIIVDALLPFIEKIKAVAIRFRELSPETKKVIVIVAALAAAIGPVLVILGTIATTAIPALIAGFTALTGPIGLVIAALAGIAVVVYKNWDGIKKYLVDTANYFIDLYNESTAFRIAVQSIVIVFKTVFNIVKLVIDGIITGFKTAAKYTIETFENIGAAIKAALTGNISAIPEILQNQLSLAADSFSGLFDGISKDVEKFSLNMKTDVGDALDAVTKRKKITFLSSNVDASAIKDAVSKAVNKGVNPTVPDCNCDNSNSSEGTASKITKPLAVADSLVPASLPSPLDGIVATLPDQADIVKTTLTGLSDNMVDITDSINSSFQGLVSGSADFIGNFVENLVAGTASLNDVFAGIFSLIADFMENLGKALIATGVASEAFKKVFASGWGAIAAGAALIALAGAVKGILSKGPAGSSGGGKRVALADGGIAFSPVNALVGEYSGARTNPEVIAPLNKLKGMLADTVGGGQLNGQIQLKIRGTDLVGVIDSSNVYISRRR